MKKKKREKKTENTPPKHSFGKIVRNCTFMLRMMFRISPTYVLMQLLINVLNAFTYFLTGTYVIRFIVNGYQDGMSLQKVVFLVILAYVARLIFNWSLNYYWAVRSPLIHLRVQRYMDSLMFDKLESLELARYENTEFYDSYVKVASDMLNRLYGVFNSFMNVLSHVLNFSLYTFMVLEIDPVLIIFAVVPLVSTYFLTKADNKIAFDYDMSIKEKERQRDYTRRTFYLQDYAKEMRLSGIWQVMLTRFDTSVKTIIDCMNRRLPLHAALQFLIGASTSLLSESAAMIYSVYQTVVSGSMKYGDCIVVINSIGALSWFMSDTMVKITDFQAHSLYIENLRSFLDFESTLKGGDLDTPKGADLVMNNISFRYDSQKENVLDNVSISIKNGEKIALVGHNGAGKSTLAKLMMRLYDPTNGTITYGGEDIRSYKLSGEGGYRDRYAVVFQDFKLFAMSVKNNILLRREREGDDELVAQALERSGAAERIAALPHGADSILTREFDDDGVVLSGGEGQKVVIARAFAKDADIVILDEPSSALDPIAEYKMYENMMKACENKSVVFISHRLSSATLADTIYLLEHGKVIECGSHQDLMKKNGKYAELFRIQAENYITETEMDS